MMYLRLVMLSPISDEDLRRSFKFTEKVGRVDGILGSHHLLLSIRS